MNATLEQALSNVLPKTHGDTHSARSTVPASDPTAITDVPLRPVAEQTHEVITTSWGDVHRLLTLYFSEVSSDIHGPLLFKPDERIEQIQQWLEEDTFRDRCVYEETHDKLAMWRSRRAAAWCSTNAAPWMSTPSAAVTR